MIMKSTRLLLFIGCLIFALSIGLLFSGEVLAQDSSELKVGVVTSVGGLGDEGFNDMAYEGLIQAKEDFDLKTTLMEPEGMADFEPFLTQLAEDGHDLVIGVGFFLKSAIEDVAEAYPDTKFLLIDELGYGGDNLMSMLFAEQEGSFLAGVASALYTETDVVGWIGGVELPPVESWKVGFVAGAKTINPEIDVLTSYVGSFENPGRARQQALTMYDQGADIIMHVGGRSGLGVLNAADTMGEGYYAIASDACQYDFAPGSVLATIEKGVNQAVYETIELVREDQFDGTSYVLGLEVEGMRLSDKSYETIPPEILAIVEEYQEKIINEDIILPENQKELEEFLEKL